MGDSNSDPELEQIERLLREGERRLAEWRQRQEQAAVEELPPEERRKRWRVITGGGAVVAAVAWAGAQLREPRVWAIAALMGGFGTFALLPGEGNDLGGNSDSPTVAAPAPELPAHLVPDHNVSAEMNMADEPEPEPVDVTEADTSQPAPTPAAPEPEPEPPSTPEPELSAEQEPEPSEPTPAPSPEPEPTPTQPPEPEGDCARVLPPRTDLGDCVRELLGLLDELGQGLG